MPSYVVQCDQVVVNALGSAVVQFPVNSSRCQETGKKGEPRSKELTSKIWILRFAEMESGVRRVTKFKIIRKFVDIRFGIRDVPGIARRGGCHDEPDGW